MGKLFIKPIRVNKVDFPAPQEPMTMIFFILNFLGLYDVSLFDVECTANILFAHEVFRNIGF